MCNVKNHSIYYYIRNGACLINKKKHNITLASLITLTTNVNKPQLTAFLLPIVLTSTG